MTGALGLAAAYLMRGDNAQAGGALPKGVALGPEQPFSWDKLKEMADALAASPWYPPTPIASDVLARIDYDAYQQARYRRNMSLQLARDGRRPVQLFLLGAMFREAVKVHVVDAGTAREVLYR